MSLDAKTLERHPLIDERGIAMLRRLREDEDAPRFNHATGDRLRAEDVSVLEHYRERVALERGPRSPGPPPPAVIQRVATWRETIPIFQRTLPPSVDLESGWETLPTTSRADLAREPWEFVPVDAPLDRMVIYRTAGTTGHPITVPHHPIAVRLYEPLLEHALGRYGIRPEFGPDTVACFLVGAQIRTYTYAAVLSAWGQAGFAKLNIRQTEWPREHSQHRYFERLAPRMLTGDPISFSEMMRMDLPARPLALVSTSVAMSPKLKERLSTKYQAPVIDWYSLVETGPIGYACRLGGGAYHVLPPDVYVEALRPDGTTCAAGERGEIAVTGGRNPFGPLVRYRTGDWGRIEYAPCPCGDPMPRLLELEGRVPVLIRAHDGTPVSNVDLSRLLREHPLLLHEFSQRGDGACELVCRALPNHHPDPARIEADLRRVLGAVPLTLRFDPTLGDRVEGKVVAYRSELLLED